MTLKTVWNADGLPAGGWSVWSEVLCDAAAGGGEEHCRAIASSPGEAYRLGRVGVHELALRSPDGAWYRWDGSKFMLRPEDDAVRWCDLDGCPTAACPGLPGCGAPAGSLPARCLTA